MIQKIFIAGNISSNHSNNKKNSVWFFPVYAKTESNTEIFSCVCQTASLIQKAPCTLSPIAGDPYKPVVCQQNSRLPLYLYGSHPKKKKGGIKKVLLNWRRFIDHYHPRTFFCCIFLFLINNIIIFFLLLKRSPNRLSEWSLLF